MCKPSCCPGNSGSGFGPLVVVIGAILFIAAIADPVIHAVEVILRIAIIGGSTVAAVAIVTTGAVIAIRYAQRQRALARSSQQALPVSALRTTSSALDRRSWQPELDAGPQHRDDLAGVYLLHVCPSCKQTTAPDSLVGSEWRWR
jgi:hypothetical protein